MPKIIEQLYDKIIEVTKEELEVVGYDNLKLRNIANKCDIAVGTIYNYFKSKEYLVAIILSAEWNTSIEELKNAFSNSCILKDVIKLIYLTVEKFYFKYKKVFDTYTRSDESFSDNYKSYHVVLRKQITDLIVTGLETNSYQYDDSSLPIISEIILTCAMHNDINIENIQKTIYKILEVKYE